MANICNNKFYFSCENNFDFYNQHFIQLFEDHFDGDITFGDVDDCWIEGYFETKWSFPDKSYFDWFCKEDECYFRCLSEEYGLGYVAMNIYEDGEWKSEQTFEL